MKQTSAFSQSSAFSQLLATQGQSRPLRPEPFLTKDDGKPLSATTLPAALSLVKNWRPKDTLTVHPFQPGWAGLQPYKVTGDQGPVAFLKLCMVDEAHPIPTAKDRQAVMDEGARATWAGRHGVGPKVLAQDSSRGGLLTDWVEGNPITDASARGEHLPAFVDNMSRLHRADPVAMPSDGAVHWLQDKTLTALANVSKMERARYDSLLQLEASVERVLARSSFHPVPIHDDLHRRNALQSGEKITFVDWNNLKLGDAMTDLGHFAAFADIHPERYASMLERWDVNGSIKGEHAQIGTPNRLALRALYFDLRNMAFHSQWPGPVSTYLFCRIQDDVRALAPLLRQEEGLRCSLA